MATSHHLLAAHAAREGGQWNRAIGLYQEVLHGGSLSVVESAATHHHLGLCYFATGRLSMAKQFCQKAIQLNPLLWQAAIMIAKSEAELSQVELADQTYQAILKAFPGNERALLGRADLALNQFGDPCQARELVSSLHNHPDYHMDARLTGLMSRLYDRDAGHSAMQLNKDIMEFSRDYLQLKFPVYEHPVSSSQDWVGRRPRVGLLSPQFGVSPVYFLTIAGWRTVAGDCDLVLFNRGHMKDWATEEFESLASEVHSVQHLPARELAQTLYQSKIDILYDLGGWMDPIGLQALSLRPAPHQFKWVGGQSVTTGLNCFAGWIGDENQSPKVLQSWYSEPLINATEGYASYTPPPYMPKPARLKSKSLCIFSNPAKISREFLMALRQMKGEKVFIHRQYRFPRVQHRILEALEQKATFISPASHQEALQAVNQHQTMIDTFPYSSGLTAREALALGTKIKVLRVGELFCERHTAYLASP